MGKRGERHLVADNTKSTMTQKVHLTKTQLVFIPSTVRQERARGLKAADTTSNLIPFTAQQVHRENQRNTWEKVMEMERAKE